MCCSLKVVFFIRTLSDVAENTSEGNEDEEFLVPMTLKGVDAVGRGKKRGRRAPVGKEITKKQIKMKMMQMRVKRVMRSEHLEQPGAFPGGKDGGVGGGCNRFQKVPGQGSEY